MGAWLLRNAAYPGKIHVHRKTVHGEKKCDGSDHLGHLCIGMRLPDRILRKNVPGRRTADSRRAEDGIYRLCEKTVPELHRRYSHGGHHCGVHVYGGLTAAGGIQFIYVGYIQADHS